MTSLLLTKTKLKELLNTLNIFAYADPFYILFINGISKLNKKQ